MSQRSTEHKKKSH